MIKKYNVPPDVTQMLLQRFRTDTLRTLLFVVILMTGKSCPLDQNLIFAIFTKITMIYHYITGGGGRGWRGLKKKFQKTNIWLVNSPLYNWLYIEIDSTFFLKLRLYYLGRDIILFTSAWKFQKKYFMHLIL